MSWQYFCRPCGIWRDYEGNEKQPMVAVRASRKLIWIPLCAACGRESDCSVIPDWSGPKPRYKGDVVNAGELPFFEAAAFLIAMALGVLIMVYC